MIAFRQLDGSIYLLLYLIDDAAEVALGNITTDHDLTLHILAIDRVRTCHGTDFGDIAQRDFLTTRIDHQITDILHCGTAFIRSLYRQVKCLAIVIYLADSFAPQHDIDILLKLRQRDAILCHQLTLRCNGKLRTLDLLFHFQVHQTGDSLYSLLDLVTDHKHQIQVRTEQFDCNIRLRTGEHGVDTMRNRLSYFDVSSTDGRQFLTDIIHNRIAATVFQDKRSFDFRYVYP